MQLINASDLKVVLDISDSTLWRYIETSRLPAPFKVGNKRYWRQCDLESFFETLALAQ
jgi:predicted DNA-binding transcriptional regulator AlpA